jgi:hypothetical protein
MLKIPIRCRWIGRWQMHELYFREIFSAKLFCKVVINRLRLFHAEGPWRFFFSFLTVLAAGDKFRKGDFKHWQKER